MIAKNEIKFVRSLNKKKNRIKSNQFIVEGEKIVDELIDSSLELVKEGVIDIRQHANFAPIYIKKTSNKK